MLWSNEYEMQGHTYRNCNYKSNTLIGRTASGLFHLSHNNPETVANKKAESVNMT